MSDSTYGILEEIWASYLVQLEDWFIRLKALYNSFFVVEFSECCDTEKEGDLTMDYGLSIEGELIKKNRKTLSFLNTQAREIKREMTKYMTL